MAASHDTIWWGLLLALGVQAATMLVVGGVASITDSELLPLFWGAFQWLAAGPLYVVFRRRGARQLGLGLLIGALAGTALNAAFGVLLTMIDIPC